MHGIHYSVKKAVDDRMMVHNAVTSYVIIKRLFDIFASIVGLVLFSPVIIITALAIKINSPGPVFFFTGKNRV